MNNFEINRAKEKFKNCILGGGGGRGIPCSFRDLYKFFKYF